MAPVAPIVAHCWVVHSEPLGATREQPNKITNPGAKRAKELFNKRELAPDALFAGARGQWHLS